MRRRIADWRVKEGLIRVGVNRRRAEHDYVCLMHLILSGSRKPREKDDNLIITSDGYSVRDTHFAAGQDGNTNCGGSIAQACGVFHIFDRLIPRWAASSFGRAPDF